MSLVLGIHNGGHDSSAAVFRDGQLVAAISEERLCRIKCIGGDIPHLAIDAALKEAGATRRDVTDIGLMCGYFPEEYFSRISKQTEAWRKFVRFRRRIRGKATERIWTGHILREAREAGVAYGDCFRTNLFLRNEGFSPSVRVTHHLHHPVHAILAGYYSGFDKCLVVTIDGYGDLGDVHTSGIYNKGKVTELVVTDGLGKSAGMFYEIVTELLGFRPLRHEGKVLGLAAFGDPQPLLQPFSKALRVAPCGTRFDSDFLDPTTGHEDRKAFLAEAILGHSRENIAAAAQQTLEDSVLGVIRSMVTQTGVRQVALNGGVAANVKLNQRIAALPIVDKMFVFPAMSDTGNSVGAGLCALEAEQPGYLSRTQHALHDVYLGPQVTDEQIEKELTLSKLPFEKLETNSLIERAARAIHDGYVVGWFQGRMEFGPRALGNRSMVGRPTDAKINKELNDRLDRTEFMPFAPSVLAECAENLFLNVPKAAHSAEFMTVTFDVRDEWKPRIPAVVHVDGTARPQLVRADRNPIYHALIRRYQELSGIPLVLNTSFNVHEEPIVCGAAEAVRALREDRIDALAIGSYWVPNSRRMPSR